MLGASLTGTSAAPHTAQLRRSRLYLRGAPLRASGRLKQIATFFKLPAIDVLLFLTCNRRRLLPPVTPFFSSLVVICKLMFFAHNQPNRYFSSHAAILKFTLLNHPISFSTTT